VAVVDVAAWEIIAWLIWIQASFSASVERSLASLMLAIGGGQVESAADQRDPVYR
jgi:hypothetical protein